MTDVDIDPFGEDDKTEEPTEENIPLDPVTPAGGGCALWAQGHAVIPSTWELEREQETSLGGTSRTSVLHKEYLVGEIYVIKLIKD